MKMEFSGFHLHTHVRPHRMHVAWNILSGWIFCMSFPLLHHQLQTPLLNGPDNDAAMARQQARQLRCCDDNDEDDEHHHVPSPDGIFRVIQQPHEPILRDENSMDDRDGNVYASNISQQQQQQQQWYQQPQQLSAMISNFSTSYNAVNVSLVLPILKVAMHRSSSSSSAMIDENGFETSSSSSSLSSEFQSLIR